MAGRPVLPAANPGGLHARAGGVLVRGAAWLRDPGRARPGHIRTPCRVQEVRRRLELGPVNPASFAEKLSSDLEIEVWHLALLARRHFDEVMTAG